VKTKALDSKGRLVLGKRFAGRTVIIDDSDPARIVVTLAVVIPEREAWLYRNPQALRSVRKGLTEAKNGQFVPDPPDLTRPIPE
jgi:hypothetical protein